MNQDVEKIFGVQKLINLLQKANNNQDYIALRNVVDRGFPPKSNMLKQHLKEYWIFKDEVPNFKGFILINDKRIIIPVEARKEVL